MMVDTHEHNELLKAQLLAASAAHDKLEDLLGNWATWMNTGGNPEHKVISRSIGKGYTHYGETDYRNHLEIPQAKTVDAIINHDIGKLERRALYCEYLGATWNDDVNLSAALVLAREGVRLGCHRKGLL